MKDDKNIINFEHYHISKNNQKEMKSCNNTNTLDGKRSYF